MAATEGLDPVDLVRRAVAEGDRERAARLISAYPLELWFGMLPSDLHLVLQTVASELGRIDGFTTVVLRGFLSGWPQGRSDDAASLALEGVADPNTRSALLFMQALRLRLAGDAAQAHTIMSGIPQVREPVAQLLDPSRGLRACLALQAGITAMLAGRFGAALALLEKTLVFPIPPMLRFFQRDAHLSIALIHALYGDHDQARSHWSLAREVPRTRSWAEAILDTDERLVEIMLLADEDPDAAFSDLLRIPIPQMQELWPFHVVATEQLGMVTDRIGEMRDRVERFRDIGLAGADGPGFAGSVIAHALAVHALLAGAGAESERLLSAADADLWETATIGAGLALVRGAVSPAISLLRGAADHTRGLRRADSFRRMVLAVAHDVDGAHDAAEAILSDLVPGVDGLTATMLIRFAPTFAARAAERVPGWPVPPTPLPAVGTLRRQALTTRELDVLVHLSRGESRNEVARALFITVNTVKTHQRSLYRKLGVGTRSEAIREGRRRALV